MDNKILVNLIIPTLEVNYNAYLPISKRIGNIIFLLVKAINEMGITFEFNSEIALYNRYTGEIYNPNDLLIDTDIRNGSEIILL